MNETPGPNILLVEDDWQTLEALRDAVAGAGFRCTAARGGAAGFRAFSQGAFDLVVTDLNMAGGDGYVLMRRVRQAGKTPLLVITGCNTAYAQQRVAQDFPGVKVLTKPFARARFLDTIQKLLTGGETRPRVGELVG